MHAADGFAAMRNRMAIRNHQLAAGNDSLALGGPLRRLGTTHLRTARSLVLAGFKLLHENALAKLIAAYKRFSGAETLKQQLDLAILVNMLRLYQER